MNALVGPLDAARAAALRVLGRRGRTFLGDRARRVALYGVVGVLAALLLTCLAPLWVFALGPILLGVPHLVADVRYLIVRPRLHQRRALAIAVAVPLVAVVIEPTATVGLTAGLGVIVLARTTTARRVAAALAWTAMMLAAQRWPLATSLGIVHGHNVLAVILFLLVFARRRLLAAGPALLFAGLALALLLGAFDAWLMRPAALASVPATGLSAGGVVSSLAPLSDPVLALRLAFLFVFAQSVHYAVWLRLVPEEARERPGIRSFAASLRALHADLGLPLLVLSLVAAVGLLLLAARSLEVARLGYLRVAAPHAYLEMAFALLVLLEGRRSATPASTA